MNNDEFERFLKALHLSARQHASQRRKDALASAYINHPIHLVKVLWEVGKVREPDVLIAALLHDTLEDTVERCSPEYDRLAQEIGGLFGSDVRSVVEEVTDDKCQSYKERKKKQIQHAGSLSRHAKLVKLADKISNVSDILINPPAKWTVNKKREYLEWAGKVVKEIRGTNEALEKEFDTWVSKGHGILDDLDELENRFEVIPGAGEIEDR